MAAPPVLAWGSQRPAFDPSSSSSLHWWLEACHVLSLTPTQSEAGLGVAGERAGVLCAGMAFGALFRRGVGEKELVGVEGEPAGQPLERSVSGRSLSAPPEDDQHEVRIPPLHSVLLRVFEV